MSDEYRKILIELYKENQNFLNKAIFSVSVLAIPLLFKSLSETAFSSCTKYIFTSSLVGFFIVIVLQILSLKSARDGCDEGLLQDEHNKSNKLFDRARTLDKWREFFFILSLFLIVLAFIFNILNMENNMTNDTNKSDKTQIIEAFTPPKSIEKKSFVPPKTIVSDNNSGGKNQTSEDGSSSNQEKE